MKMIQFKKKPKKICLLLTSCIYPNKDVPFLELKDSKIRKQQYLLSIEFFIKESNIDKIVFCDSSNAKEESYLTNLAKKYNKNFEWISFVGNNSLVNKFGKGYGEGEIIEYALRNSILLKKSDYILKITGRMIVKNIDLIIKTSCKYDFYCYPILFNNQNVFLSTKMYIISKKLYEEYFLNKYNLVRDMENIYLENIFAKTVLDNNLKTKVFRIDPDFVGYSGTTGEKLKEYSSFDKIKNTLRIYWYKIKEIKCRIQNMRKKLV